MKFPRVQRIVYSTCSIYSIENEGVVCQALKSEEARSNFKLAPPEEVLPSWHRRGLPDELEVPEYALSSIRCSPNEDATNGFFVSCFVSDRTQAAHSGHGITTKKRKRDEGSSRKKRKAIADADDDAHEWLGLKLGKTGLLSMNQ